MAYSKTPHDVYECCNRAAATLKEIGFVLTDVSDKTEATYFKYPGRYGVLRVAAHRQRRQTIGLDRIVAKLTFHGNRFAGADILVCNPDKIDTMIALAIGQYFLRSTKPLPSLWRGKRGTWESKDEKFTMENTGIR